MRAPLRQSLPPWGWGSVCSTSVSPHSLLQALPSGPPRAESGQAQGCGLGPREEGCNLEGEFPGRDVGERA